MPRSALVCTAGLLLFAATTANGQLLGAEETMLTMDIMPRRCPNTISLLQEQTIPRPTPTASTRVLITVALAGSAEFDIHGLDPETVFLEGVAPASHGYQDVISVGVPSEGGCYCYNGGPDGYSDLVLEFDRAELLAALAPVNSDESRMVGLTALTKSNEAMEASDCLKVQSVVPAAPDHPVSRNYPNPFNAATVISYDLVSDGNVKLDVYNVLGRHVATLASGYQPAGTHQLTWNATDGNGTPVASGMYFYRLIRGGVAETKRMVLLR